MNKKVPSKPSPTDHTDDDETMLEQALFKVGTHVVYPTHGVGCVQSIESMDVKGQTLYFYVVFFDKDRMTLRVPFDKVKASGLRRVSSRKQMDEALRTLKGRARVKRVMWSRRAQEYEAKINSGDPVAIAEVVRDLHRNTEQSDQSFSERQIYENARDRLVLEVATIDKTNTSKAIEKITELLSGN